ncbi:hypothetical protein PInf_017000 [Phytophthora infestans]|nr:hypothetical protein PInf_017000 [Phytophthora infestans]
MAMKGVDTGQGDERDVPCALQSDLRAATGMDRWTGFLQVYGSFITRELTQQHPQFARALCQLERDTRLEQERQSAQILATLRVKDARISELQKVVSEQREQLDVVLDELERRETKEDAAVQTEGGVKATKEIDTQTENREEEKGVLVVLEKLERELKTLEDKNLTLEKELQQRVKRTEKREKLEDNDEIKNCLETLQRGIQAMDLSCGCMRKHLFQPRHCDEHYVVKEFVRALGNGKNGVKDAAKMVRKWAGWEAKHLDEVRSLRRGFTEERAVDRSRKTALFKRIDQLERRELDLQAEVNALRQKRKLHVDRTAQMPQNLPFWKLRNASIAADKRECLTYPQLLARLATMEQSLLAKDEQLSAANETIRALSVASDTVGSCDSVRRLSMELQRVVKQKFDFFQRREQDLVTVSRYFEMEKTCLQLQSRLEVEKKQVAILKAAKEVCDNERDELLMKVEKLETETLLATINGAPLLRNNKQTNDDDNATLFIDRVELMNESLTEGIQNSPTSKDMSKVKDPFLASVKPQTPADRTSGNGCDNEAALPDNSALMEDRKRMSLELEECLAKCAYLTSQNSKLAGRLKTAKETNEQHLKEQEELRTKLSARRSETTLEFKQTIEEDRDQDQAGI